jgi:two-component system sensor histidine kinase UhpB
MHPELAICFFRVNQEALRNGVTHAAATRFVVSLLRFRDEIELKIVDDGRGFDLEAVRREGRGLGLVSMEERAHIVGARLEIASTPGEGTSIRLCAPFRAAAADAPPAATSDDHASVMQAPSSH